MCEVSLSQRGSLSYEIALESVPDSDSPKSAHGILNCGIPGQERIDVLLSLIIGYRNDTGIFALSGLFPQFGRVTRKAVLDAEDNLCLEDVFENGGSRQTVVWIMNTEAVPEIVSDDAVRLTCRGHEMSVKFRATSPFSLKILPADPPAEYDAPNPGVMQVCLVMDTRVRKTEKIKVCFQNADRDSVRGASSGTGPARCRDHDRGHE